MPLLRADPADGRARDAPAAVRARDGLRRPADGDARVEGAETLRHRRHRQTHRCDQPTAAEPRFMQVG